jgi:Fe2+ or Zn2+ uptake regulation protein
MRRVLTLTERQLMVLGIVYAHEKPMTPTQIGRALKFDLSVASPSVTRTLQRLVLDGALKREAVNGRVVRYAVVDPALPHVIVGSRGRPPDSFRHKALSAKVLLTIAALRQLTPDPEAGQNLPHDATKSTNNA